MVAVKTRRQRRWYHALAPFLFVLFGFFFAATVYQQNWSGMALTAPAAIFWAVIWINAPIGGE